MSRSYKKPFLKIVE